MKVERTFRRKAVAATLLILVTLLGGCTSAPESTSRPLTGDEAERLAVVRFRNFDAGVRQIHARIPGTAAGEVRLEGWFDFGAHTGYGAAFADDGDSLGLVWWDDDTIATRETPVDDAPLPAPSDAWISGPLDPSSTPLTAVLTLIGSLGADRPENPQLLRQSDAAWIRSDHIDGVDVDVFAGPSDEGPSATESERDPAGGDRTRFWVDSDGVLQRFQARLGSADEWTTVDLSAGDVTVPDGVPGG